jgi:large subunit ribosomal protein L32
MTRNHFNHILIIMAVPKKRTSKSKKNARKANWKRKAYQAGKKSLSLAKSMLRGKTTSFVYSAYDEDE